MCVPSEKGSQKITDKQQELVDILKNELGISRKELSERLSINESAVQKWFQTLKNIGIISHIGPSKGG